MFGNVNIDDLSKISSIDREGMLEMVLDMPEQFVRFQDISSEWHLPPASPSNIVVIGMGGSAIGGDLLRACLEGELMVPMQSCRAYDVPAWVGKGTLAITLSYSGNTEESLAACRNARRRGAGIVAFSVGGKLEEYASADGFPHFRLPPGLQPRAALGFIFLSCLWVLETLEIVPKKKDEKGETIEILRHLRGLMRPEAPLPGNLAKQIAGNLVGKMPVVYGSYGFKGVVAYRWKCQFNENAKVLASWNVFPEMTHNETSGWGGLAELYQNLCVLFLRDRADPPRIERRVNLAKEIIGKRADIHEIWACGASPMARMFSLVYLGDLVSVYLAILQEIDPTPIRDIDHIKEEMSRFV